MSRSLVTLGSRIACFALLALCSAAPAQVLCITMP